MKNKKIIIELLSVLFVACIAISVGVLSWKHIQTGSETKTYLNKIPRLEDSLVDTIEADGLKIDMISCIYDKETNIGISVFAIQGGDGEVKQYSESEEAVKYNGNDYILQTHTSAGKSYRNEVRDGVLYQYFAYGADVQDDDDNYIGLYKNEDLDNHIAKFELKDEYASDNLLYFNNNSDVVLSSVGIKMEGLGSEDEIILKYNDGKQRRIKYPSIFTAGNIARVQFGEMIDIDGVTSIMCGNNEYELSGQ